MGFAAKVISDSAVTAVRILVSTIRGLIIIPLITNLLGASEYGIWATILAFVGLMGSAGEFHLHGSLVRYSSRNNGKEQTYIDILTLSTIIGILLSMGIIALGISFDIRFLFDGVIDDQNFLVAASSLLVFSTILFQININFPRSKGMVKIYDLLQIGKQLLEIMILLSVFLLGGTIVTGIIGLAVTTFLVSIAIITIILIKYKIPNPNIYNFGKYLRYGGPMVPKEISSKLLTNADRYLILYLISPSAVGIYAVAHSVSQFLTQFSKVLDPTLYPLITTAWDEGKIDEVSQLYTQIFRYYSLLAIPAFFGISFLSHHLMMLLSTASIAEDGYLLIPVLAAGFLLRGYDNNMTYILNSTEKTGQIAKAIMISATANIPLNIIMINHYGVYGAAVATTISNVIAFYLIYKYAIKELKFDIPLMSIGRCIVASLIMFVCLYLIDFVQSSLYAVVIYPIIGVGIYFISIILLGEITPTERKKIGDYIQTKTSDLIE